MGMNGHNNLLHGSVTCTLADTVDSDFNLTSTVRDTSKGVGGSETEIVVTVSGPNNLL